MTSRIGRLLSVAILCCIPARAGEPKAVIDGPSSVRVDKSIVLSGEKSASEKPLTWKLLSPPGVVLLSTDVAPRKNVNAFVLDPEAGEYIFSLVAKGKVGDEWEADVAIHRVIVGATQPQPTPGPSPGPTPGPTPPPGPSPPPTSEVAHCTLIYDEATLRTARPEVRSALARDEIEGKLKVNWHAYDDDQEAVADYNLAPFVAKAGGVPALIFQAADGRVLESLPCPPSPEGVRALVGATASAWEVR